MSKEKTIVSSLEILVVEDDELQRRLLFDLLKKNGHNVKACDCLVLAKEQIKKEKYDLMFLDMCLPDGDGLALLEKLKQDKDFLTEIVIMTAYADIATALKAIRLGAYDYLPKPFGHEQVEKIVKHISSQVELSQKVESLSRLSSGEYAEVWKFDEMIGTEALRSIFEKAQRIAAFPDTTVLLLGESGTGKGMMANAIHRLSRRADKPFVDINCSAIPGQLMESEVFGYEKGAFTDAKNSKPGLLEIADGGTVFLDEIGDMDAALQGKLLKVIEDKHFRRLGGSRICHVDVRIVAATCRDLKAMVADGAFREDLYYRLSVVPLVMPPLREHRGSIVPLAEYCLKTFCRDMGRQLDGFTDEAVRAMESYDWPGNVRELRNAIERSVILARQQQVDVVDLGLPMVEHGSKAMRGEVRENGAEFIPMSLREAEKRLISGVLAHVKGHRGKAADILEVHRTTLYKKIEEYGLT